MRPQYLLQQYPNTAVYVPAYLCGGSYPSHELKAYYQHLLQEDGLDLLRPAARLGIFASNFPGVLLYMWPLPIYVSAYYYLYMCPHTSTYICVRIQLAAYESASALCF